MTTWQTWQPPGAPFPFASMMHNEELFFTVEGGHDPATGEIADSATDQTRMAWTKVTGLLEQAGFSLSDVLMVRPYVTAREYAAELDAVCAEVLGAPMPACGPLLVVDLIDPRMKIEIEVFAQKGAHKL